MNDYRLYRGEDYRRRMVYQTVVDRRYIDSGEIQMVIDRYWRSLRLSVIDDPYVNHLEWIGCDQVIDYASYVNGLIRIEYWSVITDPVLYSAWVITQ